MKLKILGFLSFFLVFSCTDANFSGLSLTSVSQGSGGMQEESFDLSYNKSKVDILILPDTSESMNHHLQNFGESLRDLLSVISDYDWRIGITSTDHGDHGKSDIKQRRQDAWTNHPYAEKGKFGTLMPLQMNALATSDKRFLTKNTPNFEEVFRLSLSHDYEGECHLPPYCQNHLEQPLRSLKSFIERSSFDKNKGGNSDFFRGDADFVAIILTNEDERNEDQERATTASQVIKTFNERFSYVGKKFFAFSFLVANDSCFNEERDRVQGGHALTFPKILPHLATGTGGYNSSICSKNYGADLSDLSQFMRQSIENSVVLKHDPVPQTIHIEFSSGKEIPWEVFGRKIIFDTSNSKLSGTISYQKKLDGV